MRLYTLTLLALLSLPLHAQTPVKLKVDATDAARRLFHVQMSMPAKPGPMTLLYPEWIPGEHGPTGPIANLVGLKLQAGGKTIPWKRDSDNMYAFHLDVPAGATTLDVAFDFISPPESGGFTSGSSTTTRTGRPELESAAALSAGRAARRLPVPGHADRSHRLALRHRAADPARKRQPDRVPAGFAHHHGGFPRLRRRPLQDFELGGDAGTPHYLHVAADSDRALEASPELIGHFKDLVKEAGALFGAHHYRSYHFLYTLSDHVAHFGLEHHESSDDRTGERTLIDPDALRATGYLLPHEFVHSWNGKYRRPAGLISGGRDGGYDTPMKGDLLWVYEGLTNYLGEILTPRSGLWSAEDYRESLAETAAELDNKFGRTWRPLEDTAVAAQVLYEAGGDYQSLRRSVDYYAEGTLIWLEADVLIRQLSKGAKSLDDFCKLFHGGTSGPPALKPYNFDDVVAALNAVQPYDWAGFLNQRLHSTEARAPLGGIERSGWKLTYDGVRSDFWKAREETRKIIDLTYSIGMLIASEDGTIADVRYGGPAQKAGIAPSVKLIAVNTRQYTPTVLREAIAKTATDAKPLELLVKNGEFYQTFRIDYHGGERYPHLTRDSATPDLMTAIIAPKVKK